MYGTQIQMVCTNKIIVNELKGMPLILFLMSVLLFMFYRLSINDLHPSWKATMRCWQPSHFRFSSCGGWKTRGRERCSTDSWQQSVKRLSLFPDTNQPQVLKLSVLGTDLSLEDSMCHLKKKSKITLSSVLGYVSALTPAARNAVSPTTPPDSGSSKDKGKNFFCFEDDDETYTTMETEVMSYLKSATRHRDGHAQTISHNHGNLSEAKCGYPIQCTCWETVQSGKSGTDSKKEQAVRPEVWEAASHEVQQLFWGLNLHSNI